MGIDAVEVVLQVEEAFGVELPDEGLESHHGRRVFTVHFESRRELRTGRGLGNCATDRCRESEHSAFLRFDPTPDGSRPESGTEHYHSLEADRASDWVFGIHRPTRRR